MCPWLTPRNGSYGAAFRMVFRSCGDSALNWIVARGGAMRQNKLNWKTPRLN